MDDTVKVTGKTARILGNGKYLEKLRNNNEKTVTIIEKWKKTLRIVGLMVQINNLIITSKNNS